MKWNVPCFNQKNIHHFTNGSVCATQKPETPSHVRSTLQVQRLPGVTGKARLWPLGKGPTLGMKPKDSINTHVIYGVFLGVWLLRGFYHHPKGFTIISFMIGTPPIWKHIIVKLDCFPKYGVNIEHVNLIQFNGKNVSRYSIHSGHLDTITMNWCYKSLSGKHK